MGDCRAIVFSTLEDDWLAKERNIQALLTELYLGRGREGGWEGRLFAVQAEGGGRADGPRSKWDGVNHVWQRRRRRRRGEGEEETESALSHSTTLDAIQKGVANERGSEGARRKRRSLQV